MLRGSWDSRETVCVWSEGCTRERGREPSEGLSGGFGFPSERDRVWQDLQWMRALDGSLFLPMGLRVMLYIMYLEPQDSGNEEMEAQGGSSTCQRSHRRQNWTWLHATPQ